MSSEYAHQNADAIAHSGRSAEDQARDASSQPAAVLALLDVRPGQRILDFQAGAGYFTELLSYAVGPQGHVIAHNHSQEGVLDSAVFERRYGNGRLPNTEQIFARHNELDLPGASLDAVLMSMVYHDTYWFDGTIDWGPVDQQALLAELRDALKPGGAIVVIDHHAPAGTDPYKSAVETHRIDRAVVIRDFTVAGFVLETESELLGNPGDDRNMQVFAEQAYRDTDRFMLRFVKR